MIADPTPPELRSLVDAACTGMASEEDMSKLRDLLRGDKAAQRFYLKYCRMHAELQFACSEQRANETVWARMRAESSSSTESTGLGFLGSAWQGTVGYFSQSGPFSYLIATFIMLALGVVAWNWQLSTDVQIARQFTLSSPSGRGAGGEGSESRGSPRPSFVGRITGMFDCQWKNDECRMQNDALRTQRDDIHHSSSITHHSPVSLGDKFALSSGLMEITYDTGAKVILQGPVTYEVESRTGGYLSVGKLTAKLEKKPNLPSTSGRGAGGEGGETSIHPSSFILHPLFSVRTPTAVVTDLGTEFGVEVDKEGNTTSHVYRGSVKLEGTSSDGKTESEARVLHENESARVERNDGNQDRGNRVTVFDAASKAADFVREIPRDNFKPAIRTFDLVDVVAGGDGFSGKRNSGIDATNGKPTAALPPSDDAHFVRAGDGHYHRVDGMPLVDGVFIPDGRIGRVQIDSTGRTFGGFPDTANTTSGYLWAGGAIPASQVNSIVRVLPATLDGIDYSSPGHGVLSLHANKGITFDLQAMRHATPHWKPVRFRATAGNTEPSSAEERWVYADIWVLVDGKVRFQRRQINKTHGAFSIVVPIAENDRFLTLAATDGGDDIACDFVMFGDPRLELLPTETNPQDIAGH